MSSAPTAGESSSMMTIATEGRGSGAAAAAATTKRCNGVGMRIGICWCAAPPLRSRRVVRRPIAGTSCLPPRSAPPCALFFVAEIRAARTSYVDWSRRPRHSSSRPGIPREPAQRRTRPRTSTARDARWLTGGCGGDGIQNYGGALAAPYPFWRRCRRSSRVPPAAFAFGCLSARRWRWSALCSRRVIVELIGRSSDWRSGEAAALASPPRRR